MIVFFMFDVRLMGDLPNNNHNQAKRKVERLCSHSTTNTPLGYSYKGFHQVSEY